VCVFPVNKRSPSYGSWWWIIDVQRQGAVEVCRHSCANLTTRRKSAWIFPRISEHARQLEGSAEFLRQPHSTWLDSMTQHATPVAVTQAHVIASTVEQFRWSGLRYTTGTNTGVWCSETAASNSGFVSSINLRTNLVRKRSQVTAARYAMLSYARV